MEKMFISYLVRELTKQFSSMKIPHRIVIKRVQNSDLLYDTSVTMYFSSKSLPSTKIEKLKILTDTF